MSDKTPRWNDLTLDLWKRIFLLPLLFQKPMVDGTEQTTASSFPPYHLVNNTQIDSALKFFRDLSSLQQVCTTWKTRFDKIETIIHEHLQLKGGARLNPPDLIVIDQARASSHSNAAFGQFFTSGTITWIFRMEEAASNLIFFGASYLEQEGPFHYDTDWGSRGWSHLYFFNEDGHHHGGFNYLREGQIVVLSMDLDDHWISLHTEQFKVKLKLPEKPKWRLCLNLYAETKIRLIKCVQLNVGNL